MRNITLPYWKSTQAKLAEGWSGPSILKLKLKPFSKHLKERSEAVCHPFSKQHLVQHQRRLSCDLSGRRPRRTKLSLGLYVVLLVFFIWILPLFSDQRHRIILLPATSDVMPGTTKFYMNAKHIQYLLQSILISYAWMRTHLSVGRPCLINRQWAATKENIKKCFPATNLFYLPTCYQEIIIEYFLSSQYQRWKLIHAIF